jgi:PAS domain S-box-containing protein
VHGVSQDISDIGKFKIIELNDNACKYLGYTREELLQMNIPELDAPETLGNIPQILNKLFTEGNATWEGIHMHKDGHRIPVEISNELFELHGKPMILSSVRDITDRKLAEKALLKSGERFRDLYDNAPDMYHSLDKNGIIVDCNETEAKMLGYKKEEIIGRHVTDFFAEKSKRLFDLDFPPLEQKKSLRNIEREFSRKDGTIFPASLNVFFEYDENGEFKGTKTISRDITERKRLEKQLLQAQKMESIGQLAGGIAHDFNNLLTAIIGYGNLLKTKVSQDNPLLVYVTQILNSAERAAKLTHDLLAFSRKQMINPKPVNVNNIINSMKSFLPKIIGEDIELSLLPSSKDLMVMADKHQIEHVLMNLATNARDAMPDGGSLTIRIGYREVDNEFIKKHEYASTGSYALISVEDTGQGIDKKIKERIFDPFYTTKEVGKGTGLGLSMAYGMIKQHNGYIDVQSELGKGTTFNIYLPLIKPIVEEDKKSEDLPIAKGGTETILVAEDEKYVRDFIKEVLTGYGYKVIEAIDGEDAIKVLHTHKDKIQLALLDVIMPKKDGKMVYQEIKKVSPHMKVIFISGYATDILYKKGIIEEDINFISKPMLPNELLIKVREVLDS